MFRSTARNYRVMETSSNKAHLNNHVPSSTTLGIWGEPLRKTHHVFFNVPLQLLVHSILPSVASGARNLWQQGIEEHHCARTWSWWNSSGSRPGDREFGSAVTQFHRFLLLKWLGVFFRIYRYVYIYIYIYLLFYMLNDFDTSTYHWVGEKANCSPKGSMDFCP